MQIGVVVPTYNRAILVGETLESILAQTLPAQEIVVVDDGSTDDTRAVLVPFAARGVRSVYQENAHLSAARNRGEAELSPSIDAVLFLDSDDRLLPDALARLAEALEGTPNAALSYGRPCYISPEGMRQKENWGIEDFAGPGESLWKPLTHRNFICTAGCVLVRRAWFHTVGKWDTAFRSAEDWDLWLRLAEAETAFARVTQPERPTLEYRVHPTSMSRDHTTMRDNEAAVYHKHIALLANQPERRVYLETLLAARKARLHQAATEEVAPEAALLSPHHRHLRALLGQLKIAGLYRRLPLSLRLTLRERFGVARWE